MRIVAECGSLHGGDISVAKRLAEHAKEAGADAIKFIASNPEELIADRSLKFEGESLYDIIESYRFKDDADWFELADHCRAVGIEFFASVGTPDYVPLMQQIGVSQIKFGGWDSRNYYLIDAALETGLPLQFDLCAVIDGEVDNLIRYVRGHSGVPISLMYESHGALNMLSVPYLRETFGSPVGFSADGRDNRADRLAVLYGASSLEKRLKPDDTPGHHRSKALNPGEFAAWAKQVREWDADRGSLTIEEEDSPLLGYEGLFPSREDVAAKQLWFTSLVYNRDMTAGEIITREDLAARRPGHGISPLYDYLWCGQTLKTAVKRNAICEFGHV